jgi:hypothetical protein
MRLVAGYTGRSFMGGVQMQQFWFVTRSTIYDLVEFIVRVMAGTTIELHRCIDRP